jgi:hypothetical protein
LTERALAVAGIVLVVALLPGLDALLLGTLVVAIHVVALVAEAIRRPELAR